MRAELELEKQYIWGTPKIRVSKYCLPDIGDPDGLLAFDVVNIPSGVRLVSGILLKLLSR